MRRPTLVRIDWNENRAVRFIPKPLGGFDTEIARIGNAEQSARSMSWGDETGRKLIEDFRTGKVESQYKVNAEEQQA
jgi:hypothetical protein